MLNSWLYLVIEENTRLNQLSEKAQPGGAFSVDQNPISPRSRANQTLLQSSQQNTRAYISPETQALQKPSTNDTDAELALLFHSEREKSRVHN